ncbi:MAG TPA: SdpI family protein [Candidatus Paceibacterota bacterium]|nr:SdpI family protein [Candidatus Paceibacterota bacterium]
MSSRVARTASWAILVAVWLGTILAYPSLPPVIATHWNMNGAVNGTMNAFAGAFLLPLIMGVVLLLFVAIPYIDPLRVNIGYFRAQYETFVALFMLVFALIQATLIAWNLGAPLDPRFIILPAIGVLIYYIGSILPKTRRNWFVGIRTPWTISSDRVWQKTHELGGNLFRILGIIIVLSVFVPGLALEIIVTMLVVIVLGLVLYSYWLYEEERRA